ncbi:MAG: hypothetical protein DMD45_07105 [Gemmatimonadetes bacterium]|nr:MAG: hypothetical protein DMD45_07105 [Gemmatimonadota bacterium]
MPFLFKLAKRMARLRARAVLLATAIVLAACDSPDQALSGPTPTHPSFATATGLPAGVTDLAAAAMTDTSATLTFTEVDDGTGAPASYDIRVAPTPMLWGVTVPSVKRGTCATPVAGTAIGAKRTCTVLGLTTATSYDFALVSYRGTLMVNAVFGPLSNFVSGTARTPAPTPTTAPGAVTDLAVAAATDTVITLSFTEVTDGSGQAAKYDIRYAPGATLGWGGLPSVSRGTCAAPLNGTTVGAKRTCTVQGLTTGTTYSFGLVAYRGTLMVDAVFGALSNVATGTTVAGLAPVASVSVAPGTAALSMGNTQQLTTTLQDASGNVLTGRAITWVSNQASVATVSGSGLVSAVAPGSATITATSGAVSVSSAITVTGAALTDPATVSDLKVAGATDTVVTLSFTEVNDGSGRHANYDIRYVSGSTLSWGASTPSVSRGTCAAPLSGTTIGAKRSCTVLGLTAGTTYSFELVAYRGTLSVNAVFGGLSNITTGTTTGSTQGGGGSGSGGGGGGGGGGGAGQVTYYRTNFTDGTTGPLDVYAYGGGSCAASADYRDPGSAHSIKCTIAAPGGAAALQAWFGNGQLANLPNNPTLDQDLFEQVRFVLAPGAAAAIGGTTCAGQASSSQFKVHKSVYGQAGSAWNGWAMAEIAPCTDGNIGLFSEAEMWNQDGREYAWPGTYPSLHEGTVYDVVYRYHRDTARGCGTFAMWVNGAKVMDTPCWSYMGTTNGSGQGLLFWDGATYLASGQSSLVVYNLFAQATNYPVGAGTASR